MMRPFLAVANALGAERAQGFNPHRFFRKVKVNDNLCGRSVGFFGDGIALGLARNAALEVNFEPQ
jgi:hypothetical protein